MTEDMLFEIFRIVASREPEPCAFLPMVHRGLHTALAHRYRKCDLMLLAVRSGSKMLVEWTRVILRYPWSIWLVDNALRLGHDTLVTWLIDIGNCPWDGSAFGVASSTGNVLMLAWLRKRNRALCKHSRRLITKGAAIGNSLPSLHWALETKTLIKSIACEECAIHRADEAMRWCMKHGCPLTPATIDAVVASGNVNLLHDMWEHTKGLLFTRATMFVSVPVLSARYSQLEVLKWSYVVQLEWDWRICAWAAHNDDLAMLQWALLHKCPCHKNTLRNYAVRGNARRVLAWIDEKQHSMDFPSLTTMGSLLHKKQSSICDITDQAD